MIHSAYEYKVGGSLPPDAPTYVWREADDDLFNHLRDGTFCYVLNSRQMGKSSLLVQTVKRLTEAGVICAAIDLTEIISPDITRNEFYGSITYTLADSFNLLEEIGGFETWWHHYKSVTPLKRLGIFLKDVLLASPSLLKKNIVIFLDEVDSVLRLPFSANDLFGLIRACHNNRAERSEYNRLTFAILGVAAPSDLMRDKNHSPPFNFGRAIALTGFQMSAAEPLAAGLKIKSKNYNQLLQAVLSWTGGQPFLTQKLCKLLVEAEDSPTAGAEAEWVEKVARSRIIENWEARDEPEHLKTIRDRLFRGDEQRSIQLLHLYQQILLRGGTAENDDSSEQMELRLSGLVVKQAGFLQVRNRIYESVFNAAWAEKALIELQPKPEPRDLEFIKLLDDLERELLESQLANVAEWKFSDRVLYEVLRKITFKVGELLGADRATIYLLNQEKTELWSVVAENKEGEFLDIQLRVGEGIAGQVAQTQKAINIPAKVYQDRRSFFVKEFDKKYRYRTYNILAYPILSETQEIVAVVQFLNKLKQARKAPSSFLQKIDKKGFTKLDEERLSAFVSPIRRILQICQSSYKATKKLRATAALAEATRSLNQSSLNTKEIIQRVMDAAKKLMNADRSTLWLVDEERGDLWTELPGKKLRCEIGIGFAGQVAASREPITIPFDLYDHPNAGNAKKTDKGTGYRTCSLLCMPVLSPAGELLGVTQLLNKRKSGKFPDYNPAEWPKPPEQFKASFDENDRQAMQVFNEQVGVLLQYAKTHETIKQPKEAVHNTLAMLSQAAGSARDEIRYSALFAMLDFMTASVSNLLQVERSSIFLLNAEREEFWSLIAGEEGGSPREVILPGDRGILGEILASDSRNPIAENSLSEKGGISLLQAAMGENGGYSLYELYNRLIFPLWNHQGKLVAVVEAVNKLNKHSQPSQPLSFSPEDADKLAERTESLVPLLEGFQSFRREIQTIQEQAEIDVLWSAIAAVSRSTENPKEVLRLVMELAKTLTNADRSTLWLVDSQQGNLWTQLPEGEIRCEIGVGFAGEVAQSRQPLAIPFDLYDHPRAGNAKKTDRETGYRTCSLLCMPVLSFDREVLLGVTQLVNKRKPGNFSESDQVPCPEVPDRFKASFNERDKRNMEIFNNQVGIVLQRIQQQGLLSSLFGKSRGDRTP